VGHRANIDALEGRKKYIALAGIRNTDRPACSLITILTRVITCMTGSYV